MSVGSEDKMKKRLPRGRDAELRALRLRVKELEQALGRGRGLPPASGRGGSQSREALRESRRWQAAMLNTIRDPAWLKDLQGRFLAVNEAWCRFCGLEAHEAVGKTEFRLFPRGLAQKDRQEDLQTTRLRKQLWFEEAREDRDGRVRWFETFKGPLCDAQGAVVGTVGIAHEITDRKKAEETLEKTSDLLRGIIEAAPTPIFGLDLDGNVLAVWNPAAERLLGWSSQEVMGKFLPSVPPEKHEEFRRFRQQARGGKFLMGVEVRRQKRDGTPIDYGIYASALHDTRGRIIGHVAVLVDVTERKRAEEALQAAHRESMNATETERRRLARELHDSVGQELIALQLAIHAVANASSEGKSSTEQAGALSAAAESYGRLIQEVRNICQGLYPPALEAMGLASALMQLGKSCEQSLRFKLVCPSALAKRRFEAGLEIALFRIAQEAANNVLRHGKASKMEFRLELRDEHICLAVLDDGRGFDPASRAGQGLGLTTMRDRAQTLGGTLEVTSRPGRTRVAVRVPVGDHG